MRLFAYANPSRSILRPQWLHATPHCRPFHLLRATFPATFPKDAHPLAPSRREILDIYPADFYQKASTTHIHLQTHKDSKTHEMNLETALSKFAKPGKLLLPIPQSNTHKANDVQQYHFKPINTSTFRYHINPNKTKPQTFDLSPSRDDTAVFEDYMAKIWLMLLKGVRVELQIRREGPKDIERFEKMLNRNIHLRPDVILAAMPTHSGIIIDPYTNHEKVCWIMDGPVQHPKTLKMVKPFSKMGEFHKQRREVLRAVMELEGEGLQSEEQEKGIPLYGEGYYLLDEVQQNAGILPELERDVLWGEEQENDGMLSELEGDGLQSKKQEQSDIPEEGEPHSTTPAILSPEEQELEDYKELEELTGMRPPP